MISDIILVIISLITLIIATLSDLKTREVPDFLSYFLIFSSLGIRLISSIYTKQISYFIYGFIGFAVMFIVGNLMYRLSQWGGGDSKLLMGLGAAFATKPSYTPNSFFPFLFIIFFNILIVGAVYGLLYGFCLAVKNSKKFINNFKKLNREYYYKKLKILSFILTIIFLLVTYFTFEDIKFFKMTSVLSLFILLMPYLLISARSIENSSLYKKIPLSKLREGDWVNQNIKVKNKIIYTKNPAGISKDQINLFKKFKLKYVIVKEGIPFVPPFLLGVLYSLVFGRIIFILF